MCATHHAAVLHPQYKTDYFVDENWEEEWIGAARDIIGDQWNTFYRDNDIVQVEQAMPVSTVLLRAS